jgi:hypothetical protein
MQPISNGGGKLVVDPRPPKNVKKIMIPKTNPKASKKAPIVQPIVDPRPGNKRISIPSPNPKATKGNGASIQPVMPGPRSDSGITGAGGKSVNKLYNTY